MTDSGATPSTCSPRALDRNRARASRHQAARPTNGARRWPLVRGGLLVARRALHRRRCVLPSSQPAHLVLDTDKGTLSRSQAPSTVASTSGTLRRLPPRRPPTARRRATRARCTRSRASTGTRRARRAPSRSTPRRPCLRARGGNSCVARTPSFSLSLSLARSLGVLRRALADGLFLSLSSRRRRCGSPTSRRRAWSGTMRQRRRRRSLSSFSHERNRQKCARLDSACESSFL